MTQHSSPKKTNNFFQDLIYSRFSTDTDLEVLRKVLALNLIIMIGSVFTATLGSVAYLQGGITLCIADYFIFIFLLWLFYDLRKNQNYQQVSLLGCAIIGIFFIFLFILGGVHNTAYLWALVYPLLVLFLLGERRGSRLSLIVFGMVTFIGLFQETLKIPAQYSADLIIRFIAVYITIHLIAVVMEKVRNHVQQRLQESNQELEKLNLENKTLIQDLRHSLDEIKALQGILPICSRCKKIRNDEGYWEQVDEYLRQHSDIQFTHSICPQCKAELYPELSEGKKE